MFVIAVSSAFTMSKSEVLLGNHKTDCVNDLFVSHVEYATLPFVVLIVVVVYILSSLVWLIFLY